MGERRLSQEIERRERGGQTAYWRLEQNQLLGTLRLITLQDDLEDYLDKLEQHLSNCGVPEGEWMKYLSSHMSAGGWSSIGSHSGSGSLICKSETASSVCSWHDA